MRKSSLSLNLSHPLLLSPSLSPLSLLSSTHLFKKYFWGPPCGAALAAKAALLTVSSRSWEIMAWPQTTDATRVSGGNFPFALQSRESMAGTWTVVPSKGQREPSSKGEESWGASKDLTANTHTSPVRTGCLSPGGTPRNTLTLITHGNTEDFTCPEARTWGWGSQPGGLFSKWIRPLVRVSVNWAKGDSIMYIIYIWLCWVFTAALRISLVVASWRLLSSFSTWASHCGVFSCCRVQAPGTWVSITAVCGLSNYVSRALDHRIR